MFCFQLQLCSGELKHERREQMCVGRGEHYFQWMSRCDFYLSISSCSPCGLFLKLLGSEEALKLLMSFGLAAVEFGSASAALAAICAVKPGDSARLAIPAILFVLQNAVHFSGRTLKL